MEIERRKRKERGVDIVGRKKGKNIAKIKKKNPRTGRKTYYLGWRVKDTGKSGLDSVAEVERICKKIYQDYKAGRLDKREASGRFAKLHNTIIPRTKALKGYKREAKKIVKEYWEKL